VPGVLGVDVSLGRGHDVVLVEEGAVKERWSRVGAEGLAHLLGERAPDAVAIDAPPAPGLGLLLDETERARLPVPPAPGRHLNRRVAEYELSRRGIGSHQTHREEQRLFSWMKAGFEAFRAAAGAGYPPFLGTESAVGSALEVFPYASYVALAGCLSPGRRWRSLWRRSVLSAAGVTGVTEIDSIDLLDATCAGVTGERYLRGSGCFVGDPREGVIVLPVAAMAERYRRCPPAEAVPPRSTAARLCECGCGAMARRRFLPGHDAKLRSRLVRTAREGSDARRDLERLGWSRFIREE
jgi:hypothetical protein